MVTVKKGITKANKYTKKRGRLIHNNSNNNNSNNNNSNSNNISYRC